MLIRGRLYQGGISIVELMIGMAVGLIVVGMVLSVYLTTLSTSGDTLKASRLNQEMAAMMNIMVNDIRRAGYAYADGPDWNDPDGTNPDDKGNYEEPSTNPFNQFGFTALEVHDGNDLNQGVRGRGTCIVYGYDASKGDDDDDDPLPDANDDVRDDNEFFGFKWVATDKKIMMRYAFDWRGGEDVPNSCADGDWANLNDERSTEITELTFNLDDNADEAVGYVGPPLGSTCINTAEPDGVGSDDENESDCYAVVPAANSGVRTVERRDVLITLTARLKDDPEVQSTMVQRVSVRNDLVRVR